MTDRRQHNDRLFILKNGDVIKAIYYNKNIAIKNKRSGDEIIEIETN